MLMIIFGLILTNLYSAFLNSFLVTGVPKHSSEVICYKHAFDVLSKKLPQFKFRNFEYVEFDTKLKLYNSENAYCVTDIIYEKFMYFRKSLKKHLYRLESPWITDTTYAPFLILRKDSKYKPQLKNFISIANSVGLIQKFNQDVASEQEKNLKFAVRKIDELILKTEDLKLAFLLIFCGLLLSILIFIFEHLRKRKFLFPKKSNNFFKRKSVNKN